MAFLVTANGLSYGKTLDDDKALTFYSAKPINPSLSRRVEFRIITNSGDILNKVLMQMNE